MSAELKASRSDATLILTLSNPGAQNAVDADMCAAAIETLSTAERDESLRAVVLTGADNFFCIGGSFSRTPKNHERDESVVGDTIDNLHGLIEAIRDCPKPVIAAVEGVAASAGFSLALACDMIVAGASAQFAMSNVDIGLAADGGASSFLIRSLPRQIATEILVTGKPVAASRLLELGLVNRLVPEGTALNAALAWADELAKQSPNEIEQIKSFIREAESKSLVSF